MTNLTRDGLISQPKELSVITAHAQRTLGYIQNLKRALRTRIGKSQSQRTQSLVSKKYQSFYSLSNSEWADLRHKRRDLFLEGKKCIETDGWYLMAAYHRAFDQWVSRKEIHSVLEVGSGRGQNLLTLGLKHTDKTFTGLEYSPEGVNRAKELASDPLDELCTIAQVKKASPPSNLTFTQGSAFEMPFASKSFDLSYTCLVLEQMPSQFKSAVTEMKRVTKNYCLFLEPFCEANDFMGMLHLRNVDYFRYSISEIEKLGFEIVAFSVSLPQKLRLGAGLLVARPYT